MVFHVRKSLVARLTLVLALFELMLGAIINKLSYVYVQE
jgi:hypothetical protein